MRYADDVNIYVRSERAANRVLDSVSRFIEKRLRLKVNREKSAAARSSERHFLGFRIERDLLTGDAKVKLLDRTISNIKRKLKELTPRNWGNSVKYCLSKLNSYIEGWTGFFCIADEEERLLKRLDGHIRRRLRAILLKHQKSKLGMLRCLVRRGVTLTTAGKAIYGRFRRLWYLSHCPAVERAFPNQFFGDLGLKSLLHGCHFKRIKLDARLARLRTC